VCIKLGPTLGSSQAEGEPVVSSEPPQPQVTITGEVLNPQMLARRDLFALCGDDVTIDFHYREGWSRPVRATVASRWQP
jgi:DMSO/TMAO reductase YedYZ molybdopterin-dependent catalytic subunit